MDSTSERIARLAGELADLAVPLVAANSAIRTASGEASDPRNAVSVVIDGTGRVNRVRPSALWAQRISPSELGDAVLAAVQAALAARIAECVKAVQRSNEAATAAPNTSRSVAAAASAGVDPLSDLRAVLHEVSAAIEQLDQVAEQQVEEAAGLTGTTAEDRHSRRPARVILSAYGEPAEVRVDPTWAKRATLQQITDELRRAFERAYQEFDSSAAARAPSVIELPPRMAAIAADPVGALTRYVDDLRSSRQVGR
jgi:DNA-binding protein YbaB